MNDKEIKEYLEKGYIRVNVMFEIIGHPKEHVESSLKAYIANIKAEENVNVLKEEYEDAEEIESGLFSVISEVEMFLPNIEKITWLCINFSPASIEVLEPNEFKMEARELNNWLNDLISRMHEIGIIQKKVTSQNEGLIRNFNAMTRNAILLVLREPSEINEISKKIGITDEFTQQFLEALIKEKKIKKENNTYFLMK